METQEGASMKTEIIVEPKKTYGETRIYPKCDMAKGFAQLLNQTTLTPANIQNIIRMGFTIRAEYTEPRDELMNMGIRP
jgi:hypothetical protein